MRNALTAIGAVGQKLWQQHKAFMEVKCHDSTNSASDHEGKQPPKAISSSERLFLSGWLSRASSADPVPISPKCGIWKEKFCTHELGNAVIEAE